jgi:tRNA-specific 2-thiouridylase
VAGDEVRLLRGVDADKDQSYFLFGVDGALLRRTLFPVGGLAKAVVRDEAARRGLSVATKPDSQEVCFAPPRAYATFVEQYRSTEPIHAGRIVDEEGSDLGEHRGIHRFTIGQRRGLQLRDGGPPRYVTAIDGASGTVRVGSRDAVIQKGFTARGVNWLAPRPRAGDRLLIKIRSRFAPEPIAVADVGEDWFTVVSTAGVRAPTPGQAAVLYAGERVVGGGWIAEIGAAASPRADAAAVGA